MHRVTIRLTASSSRISCSAKKSKGIGPSRSSAVTGGSSNCKYQWHFLAEFALTAAEAEDAADTGLDGGSSVDPTAVRDDARLDDATLDLLPPAMAARGRTDLARTVDSSSDSTSAGGSGLGRCRNGFGPEDAEARA